jgi:hypothetical protein
MRAIQNDRVFGRRAEPPRLVAGTEVDGTASGAGDVTMPLAKIIVVRTARWKTGLFALAATLAAALALFDIRSRLGGSSALGTLVEMAQPLLLLVAAAAFAGLVIRRPMLTISREGLALRYWRDAAWAWDDIERIEMRMSRRGFLQVVLRLRDDSGGATRHRLPGMWTTSPHQLADMLEAGRRTASKGRRKDVIASVEAARQAHAQADLPRPFQFVTRAVQQIF